MEKETDKNVLHPLKKNGGFIVRSLIDFSYEIDDMLPMDGVHVTLRGEQVAQLHKITAQMRSLVYRLESHRPNKKARSG